MREKSERQSVRQALCPFDLFEATPVLGATVFQGGLDTCPPGAIVQRAASPWRCP